MPVQYNWQGARRQGKTAFMEKMMREFNLYGDAGAAQTFANDFYKKGSNPCKILDIKPGDYRILSQHRIEPPVRIWWRSGVVASAPTWSKLLVPVPSTGKH